ncbi:MAG: hypothetical protein QN141_04735 [Armatimonadota bacterium]|nr:hypothetical protein [Armatimonadota bacterium]MDR7452548.1 hypothetical protein [Armatimonadota bacterium]MDR7466878.1 hypothetical protein [Armatimonadota bacterium]MDR7492649.1 hypothetical protein [Armatimonadota bacterium]MDR7499989.1 hypothetical protein [Armatimonadota bacterium]
MRHVHAQREGERRKRSDRPAVTPWPVLFLCAALAWAPPAAAQAPSAEALLARVFGIDQKTPYDLTADFSGTLTLTLRGGTLTTYAEGSFHETRRADGVKQRRVRITRLQLPVLLRPFRATIQRVIEEKIETQQERPETFHEHDFFIHRERSRHFIVVGVHRAIVDEAIDRYGAPWQKKDEATRRRIAHWLYTSPTQREFLVRPGPPYAIRVELDEVGTLYELTLFYDWGEVGTRIAYTTVSGQTVWQTVTADASSELSGFGRVFGKLQLTFVNHCLNCRVPRQ